MIRIGCDTGVFTATDLFEQRVEAIEAGSPLDEVRLSVSSLSLFELLSYYYRIGDADEGRTIVARISANPSVEIHSVDPQVAQRAAGLRHGIGLHSLDALILSTFIENGCDLMWTRDHHFEKVQQSNLIRIEFL